MAVNLWKFTYLRVPVKKISLIDTSYVTKFSTISVPKNQISVLNLCNYSKFRIINSKFAFPGNCNQFFILHCVVLFIFMYMITALSGAQYDFKYVNSTENTSGILRHYSTGNKTTSENSEEKSTEIKTDEKPPSLLQRFKQMYRDYWYVLVPVHLVTSAFWFSSFYYLAKRYASIDSYRSIFQSA